MIAWDWFWVVVAAAAILHAAFNLGRIVERNRAWIEIEKVRAEANRYRALYELTGAPSTRTEG